MVRPLPMAAAHQSGTDTIADDGPLGLGAFPKSPGSEDSMAPQRIRLLALLALVGVATACDAPGSIATKSVLAPRMDGTSTGYTLMTTDAAGEQTKTAVIGRTGGSIRFQGSVLVVPANAVSSPTSFTFRLQTQPYMAADLSAVDLNGHAVTTFPVPLTLTLSYARAKNQLPRGSTVVIGWIENGVVLGTVPSTADMQGKKVTGQLTHFSEWGPLLLPPDSTTTPSMN